MPQVTYAVDDLTALKAIAASNRVKNYSRLVGVDAQGKPSWYTYNPVSTATPDNNLIVLPNDNPNAGRWIKSNQSSGSSSFTGKANPDPTGVERVEIGTWNPEIESNASGIVLESYQSKLWKLFADSSGWVYLEYVQSGITTSPRLILKGQNNGQAQILTNNFVVIPYGATDPSIISTRSDTTFNLPVIFNNQSGGSLPSAKGDILSSTGSALSKLALGTDGQVLTVDSAQPSGLKWTASNESGGSGSNPYQGVNASVSTDTFGSVFTPTEAFSGGIFSRHMASDSAWRIVFDTVPNTTVSMIGTVYVVLELSRYSAIAQFNLSPAFQSATKNIQFENFGFDFDFTPDRDYINSSSDRSLLQPKNLGISPKFNNFGNVPPGLYICCGSGMNGLSVLIDVSLMYAA